MTLEVSLLDKSPAIRRGLAPASPPSSAHSTRDGSGSKVFDPINIISRSQVRGSCNGCSQEAFDRFKTLFFSDLAALIKIDNS